LLAVLVVPIVESVGRVESVWMRWGKARQVSTRNSRRLHALRARTARGDRSHASPCRSSGHARTSCGGRTCTLDRDGVGGRSVIVCVAAPARGTRAIGARTHAERRERGVFSAGNFC